MTEGTKAQLPVATQLGGINDRLFCWFRCIRGIEGFVLCAWTMTLLAGNTKNVIGFVVSIGEVVIH
jgi:hypothetical protein